MHESRIYYNIIEANAQVPRLELLFAELARVQQQVNTLVKRARKLGIEIDMEALGNTPSTHPVRRQLEERLLYLTQEYFDYLSEIENLGVVIEDLDLGIVNFYSWFDGREIFLSWQFGESEVCYWHAVNENSFARRSLKQLSRRSFRPTGVPLH